jgi:enoyl-CoA hydratase
MTASASAPVTVDIDAGLACITLNRPDRHNALSADVRAGLLQALCDVAADDRVGAVVLTGAGRQAFCAGMDLQELARTPLTPDDLGPDTPMMRAFDALDKPLIGAVNGFAVTGGFELALMCDVLVASERARFADTHARVGLVSGWGLSQRLSLAIGAQRARYLHFTGNFLDAQTAREWGLVLEVVAPDALLPRCRAIAQDMLGCDWPTLRAMKRAQRAGQSKTLAEGLAAEAQLSRESLARLDLHALQQRVDALMARGRRQQTVAHGAQTS